jgi:hypothetical protein
LLLRWSVRNWFLRLCVSYSQYDGTNVEEDFPDTILEPLIMHLWSQRVSVI